ncbi:hypothetical protein [Wenjunlia tyrosinilytica]|uniref:Uncharacterized protein n=1 Tax=Wenjunlia tyrosinilytica TaxID=1544741 RepID=A0A918E2Z4_9ACTN|nr:hypothetical protein [Wenjunlia tyrosinilytica]GGP01287.1 hypothetical protein GCM10012280_71830 [Wenjunlia tyrosinilytica]
MSPNLLVLAMTAPGTAASAALAVAAWRHRGEHDAALAVVAAVLTRDTGADDGPPTPDGGMPTVAPADRGADVITFPLRRAV